MPYRHAPVPRASAHVCPRCSTGLVTEHIGPNAVARCPRCQGMWIAAAEFNALVMDLDRQQAVRQREALKPVAYRAPYVKCPRCQRMMTRRNFGRVSGILVDTCRKHGIWLDRGELRRIVEFLAQRHATAASLQTRSARPATAEPTAEAILLPEESSLLDKLVQVLLKLLSR